MFYQTVSRDPGWLESTDKWLMNTEKLAPVQEPQSPRGRHARVPWEQNPVTHREPMVLTAQFSQFSAAEMSILLLAELAVVLCGEAGVQHQITLSWT